MATAVREEEWGLQEGDEIAPGLSVLGLLGGGFRYEVYLAWDEHRLTTVAAKVLRPDRADDPAAVDGLAAEGMALRRLDHPVLPRCFGLVTEGSPPHLILEFLDGPRLSTLLRRHGPLAVEQVLPLGLQLCSALHYMAEEGMVHLDVKPQNIVMGAPARLIDLSIARTLHDAAHISRPVGTDAYMAPEQCDPPNLGRIGPPADVWGVGATLYEAMVGDRPFPRGDDSDDPVARFPQLVVEPRPMPRDIPPPVSEPIMACLSKRPEDRLSARELAGIVQPLVDALPKRPVIGRLRPRLGRRR